jgi:hypothetical protein
MELTLSRPGRWVSAYTAGHTSQRSSIERTLLAWSRDPKVLRFDPTFLASIEDVGPVGDLHSRALPCDGAAAVYIEIQDRDFLGSPLHGAFVARARTPGGDNAPLDVVLDIGVRLVPLRVPASARTHEALEAAAVDYIQRSPEITASLMPEDVWALCEDLAETLGSILRCLRYLGEPDADIQQEAPASAGPAQRVPTWRVGFDLGQAIRQRYHERETRAARPAGALGMPAIDASEEAA